MKLKYKHYTIEVTDCDGVSKKEIKKQALRVIKAYDEAFKSYEVLWYEGEDEEKALQGDPLTKEFLTRKQALDFYNKHKDDANKYAWWVTKRDKDWYVIEDIIV